MELTDIMVCAFLTFWESIALHYNHWKMRPPVALCPNHSIVLAHLFVIQCYLMVLISFSLIVNEVEHHFRFLLTIVLWKCRFEYLSSVFILSSFSYGAIGVCVSIFGIWANCELCISQTSVPTWWFCLSALLKVLVEAQEFLILVLLDSLNFNLWLMLFCFL